MHNLVGIKKNNIWNNKKVDTNILNLKQPHNYEYLEDTNKTLGIKKNGQFMKTQAELDRQIDFGQLPRGNGQFKSLHH